MSDPSPSAHAPLQVHRYPPEAVARRPRRASSSPGPSSTRSSCLLDHAIDLSSFDTRYRNDETGTPAYPPALLLKVVLAAYAHGIVSSRGIERACQEHVTFTALCGDRAPHFTTIAHFVSTLGDIR